jgi:Pyridine nucleotide-disulphide oxidoreductase
MDVRRAVKRAGRGSDNGGVAISSAEPTLRARPRLRTVEAVVVGAGPYGLATAAHLRGAGLEIAVFGEPMASWERHMPAGMLLRSRREASSIGDPEHAWGLSAFEAAHGLGASSPVPLEHFVAYGRWFAARAAPDVDPRRVVAVEPGFVVRLEDGEAVHARRVVVAAGIVGFARRPAPFAELPRDVCSHAADHDGLARFAGQRVAVIGGGQSALESAALLAEAGAEPVVLARRPAIRWLGPEEPAPGLRYHAYRHIALGGARSSWLIARPALWNWLPFDWREDFAARTIGPAGAAWLRPRLEGVQIRTAEEVVAASAGTRVRLRLAGGRSLDVAHVLLATGYEVDVARYEFLSEGLLRHVRRRGGYPALTRGLESTVRGLHFVGAPAALTFGPVMRFVCGSWAAARGVAHGAMGFSW